MSWEFKGKEKEQMVYGRTVFSVSGSQSSPRWLKHRDLAVTELRQVGKGLWVAGCGMVPARLSHRLRQESPHPGLAMRL